MKILSFVIIFGIFLIPLLNADENENGKLLSRQKRKLIYPQFTTLQVFLWNAIAVCLLT
jgi:hypothetical protein